MASKQNSISATEAFNEKLFALLVSSVKDYAIFMLDPSGNVITWNKGAQHIKGYTADEISGRHISVFYTPEDNRRDEPGHNLNEALLKGTHESEGWRVRKDGSLFWANVVFTAVYDDAGNLLGFAKVTRDVTERKKEDDKRRDINIELQKNVVTSTKQIIENNLRYQKLIENSHDGITLLDENLKIIYRSASAERITGWNYAERQGFEITEFIHQEDKVLVTAMLTELLANRGCTKLISYRAKHKFGHFIWIECLYTNSLDDEIVKAIVCNFRDITDRKNAEETIKSKNLQLQAASDAQEAILNALPPSVALLNEDGIIVAVNESWKHFASSNNLQTPNYGITANYISIAENAAGIDREKGQEIAAGLRDIIAGKKDSFSVEYPCDSPGEKRWFQAVVAPLKDQANKGAVVLHIDITDRKEAELKLQAGEKRYRQIVETAQEGIWVMDENLRTVFVNKKICDILGYNAEEMVGRNNYEFKKTTDTTAVLERLNKRKAGNTETHETTFITKSGSEIICKVSTNGIFDDAGIFTGTLAMLTDITHYKVQENTIRQSEANLSAIIENTSDLVYSINKELKFITFNNIFKTTIKQVYNFDVEKGRSGIDLLETLDAEAAEKWRSIYNKALNGEVQQFVNEYSFGGQTVFLSYSVNPMWQDNEVIGLSCYSRDITQQKLNELAIIQSEANLRTIFENTDVSIIMFDKNLQIVSYNKNAIDHIKKIFDKELAAGTDGLSYFPDDRLPFINDVIKRLHSNEIVCYETPYYLIEGKTVWFEARWVNILNPEGSSIGIVLTVKNITAQKNADIERNKLTADLLQRNQELKLLESVVTNTTDSVMITDATNLTGPGLPLLYVNDAFVRLTGYTSEEVIGKSSRILKGPKTDEYELLRIARAIEKREPVKASFINYKKNGDSFWVDVALTPVNDDNGNCTHFIGIQRDVTSEKVRELQKTLIGEIGLIFNESGKLKECLKKVLELLVTKGNFCLAEFWSVDNNRKELKLSASFGKTEAAKTFITEAAIIDNIISSAVLANIQPGTNTINNWRYTDDDKGFKRLKIAKELGFKRSYLAPIFHNNELIGLLTFILDVDEPPTIGFSTLADDFSAKLGVEINRKQLEDELNEIFNFSPDIICIIGVDGYFKKLNPAMCEMLGFTEEELLTRPCFDFIHPEDRENTTLELRSINSGKPALYFENRYITKSGRIKWFAWTSSPASDEGLIFAVAKNITDKKELEQLLEQATKLARIGAWEVELATGKIQWSDMTREIHEEAPGFQPDMEKATSYYKEGKDREIILKAIDDAVNLGIRDDIELRIETAKGNSRWVRVIIETEFKNGRCLRLFGSFQDISDRKQAELAVTEVLTERNTILESIGDAFFAVDRNWMITYWNNTAEKVLKKLKGEVLNHNLWDVFAESVGSISYQQYHRAIATNKSVHFEDYYQPLEQWYEISAYPSSVGLSVYFKDVTSRKLSDMQLKELNTALQTHAKELAVSNAELEQFAYVASHDLQEPLRMVTSFLTLLEKKYHPIIDEKGKQYIHYAVDGAKRMRQIILDLLEYSRVTKSGSGYENVDINVIMDDIKTLYRNQVEESGAVIEYSNMPVISSHKTPVRQVFQNLVSNSLKYRKVGVAPLINVTFKDTKEHWQFCVEDNGIGIDPEYFEKIFIIFQRLHNKDEYAGTGMGLAIAKKITENFGGRIWVESVFGSGSKFFFTILKNNNYETDKNIADRR